jgi:hypothetical protein
MNLYEIAEKMHSLPTMMGLTEEKKIIAELMKLDMESIVGDWDLFSSIIADMLVSRSTSFYEIRENDKLFFIDFSQRLNALSVLVESPMKDELLDYSRIYALFP